MISVEDTITVEASPEALFAYVSEPTNQPEITPSITDVEVVETYPDGATKATYTYDMVGVSLTGETEQVAYEPGERIVSELSGDISAELTWAFDAIDGGTEVRYAAEYDLPGAALERAVRPLVERYNERMLVTTLANLKTRVEATATS
ncbi:MAG: SRPBCC family protein [Halolamina sp.]